MAALKMWTPRTEAQCKNAYSTLDRPTDSVSMFYDKINTTFTYEFRDHYTGNRVNFGNTLSGTENKHDNMHLIWRHTSGFGRAGGYTKDFAWISWHTGNIPNLDAISSVYARSQHKLPGYVGVRFQYRWPSDNNDNYWSNSPVSINDMMIHYYNLQRDEIWSYEATLNVASEANTDLWPDRYVNNSSRRSDSWKGAFYKPSDGGARSEIRNNQLFMIGVSVEMKYHDRGTAKHSRCMDFRNFTPIFDRGSEQNFLPVLHKKGAYPWTSGKKEIYLV